MDIPIDWKRVEVKNICRFSLPPTLTVVNVSGGDSFIRQWEDEHMTVNFDYGHFSDPLTLYARQRAYQSSKEQIGGTMAQLVSFQRDDGRSFTAVHFADLGGDQFGLTLKLTLVVEADPQVDTQVPLKIIKSVEFV